MRITSGILRNRQFEVPKQEVRPTKESVREAIFSSLGGRCEGLRILDLFAGAGGLGLEAWSRGAADVVFVEQHPLVFQNLKRNVERLADDSLGSVECIKADALRWLDRAERRFNWIFADPPYDLPEAMEKTLDGIARNRVLEMGGLVVYELRGTDRPTVPVGWRILREKAYGRTRVVLLERNQNEDES